MFSASAAAAQAGCIVLGGPGNFASLGVYTVGLCLYSCFTLLFVHSGSHGKGYFHLSLSLIILKSVPLALVRDIERVH